MYKVIVRFKDLQDDKHIYNAGDIFPREGVEVSKERIKELSTDKNKRHMPLIEKVKEETPEPTEEVPETVEETKSARKRGKKKNDAGADS